MEVLVGPEHEPLIVFFSYFKLPISLFGHPSVRTIIMTRAVIANPDGSIMCEGHALQSPNDNFCRITGRKVALRRAMTNGNIPREVCRDIWQGLQAKGMRLWPRKSVTKSEPEKATTEMGSESVCA